MPVCKNTERQRAEIYNPVDEYFFDALPRPFGLSAPGALSTPVESTIFRVYPRGDEVPAIHQERNVRAPLSLSPATRAATLMCVRCCTRARARVYRYMQRGYSLARRGQTRYAASRVARLVPLRNCRGKEAITCTHARNRSW